jgi:hypothetical protein
MPTEGDVKMGCDVVTVCDIPANGASVVSRGGKAVVWLLLCAACIIIASITRTVLQGVTILPWIQLLCAPLIVLAISQVSLGGRHVPLWVNCTALAGTVLGGILTYSHVDLARGAFVVARFEEDALEKETKIFRDRIRKTVGWNGLTLVGSHYESVRNHDEALALLSSNRKLGGVIWGTPRWLNVSLQHYSNLPLFEGAGDAFASDYAISKKYRQLKIITSIPGTGLSTSAEHPTVEFLGRLAQVWSQYMDALTSPLSEIRFEMLTRSLAGVKGRWTAFSHRALPMWMTGTYHLRRAVTNESDSYGETSCAIRAFNAALSQLRPSDNPELKVAVLNNLALAYFIRSHQVNHRVTTLNQAKLALKQAVTLISKSIPSIREGSFRDSIDTLQGNAKIILPKQAGRSGVPGKSVPPKVRKFRVHAQPRKGQK